MTRERLELAHQKLYDKVRSAIEQENRSAAITAFSAMLHQSLKIDDAIKTAITMVMEVMQVEVVIMFSLEAETEELRVIAYEGVDQKYASLVDGIKLGKGYCGRAAETGQAMFIENIAADPEYVRPGALEENLHAQLSVPLLSRGSIIGALCVATRSPRSFTHAEIELLTAIGNLIGIAIENSELHNERQLATEQLRLSDKKYRQLFENAHDAIWVQDLSGKIVAANQAAGELFGLSLTELIGTSVQQLVPEKDFALSKKVHDKLLRGQRVKQPFKQKLIRKDGTEAVLMLTTNLISSNGHPDGFQFIGRDITKEVRMQENQQFYLQQITKAHEEERLRISRDLHDSAAQNLIGVLHQLESFCETDEHLPMPKLRNLWSLHERLKDVFQEVRQLSRDLRPSILDHLGLLPSVDWLIEQLKAEHKIMASLAVSGERRRFSPEIEVTLFRIIQEALRNTARHAGATTVRVTIDFEPLKTIVAVADNGKGFELPATLGELSRLGKLGLDGMQTRARLIGGTFDIKAGRDSGATIIVTVPS